MWLLNLFDAYGSLISTTVLTITLFVLIFYTKATFGLRRAALEQNELRLTPWVILEYDRTFSSLWLKNIGHSPAINVSVGFIQFGKPEKEHYFKINFQTMYFIEPNSRTPLEIKSIDFKDKVFASLMKSAWGPLIGFPFFPPELQVTDYPPITINYQNLKRASFITKVKVILEEKRLEVLEINKAVAAAKR